MRENEIGTLIVEAAIEVHRVLGGPGLLESVYEEALAHELRLRRIEVRRQVHVPILYKGRRLEKRLRLDLIVAETEIVECKATNQHHPLFESQVLTYLRLLDLRLGYVVNFGQRLVKDGLHRVVNRLPETPHHR